MNWVELFAFSDHPEAALGVLDRLPQQYGYPRSLDRLLSALAKSPHESALDVLQALARRDPRLLARHDWAQAVIKLGTEKSGLTLLTLVCEGELGNAGGADSFHLSRRLAHLGEELPGAQGRDAATLSALERRAAKVNPRIGSHRARRHAGHSLRWFAAMQPTIGLTTPGLRTRCATRRLGDARSKAGARMPMRSSAYRSPSFAGSCSGLLWRTTRNRDWRKPACLRSRNCGMSMAGLTTNRATLISLQGSPGRSFGNAYLRQDRAARGHYG